ncbi:hypothetical protein AAVH_12652 [Aphelenchoides avenae]|nr:hypothetical protein AAVH_12652 [Aphelenchus avenae]
MTSSTSELSLHECVELRLSERSTRSALQAAIQRYEARKLKRRMRRTVHEASTNSLPTEVSDHLKINEFSGLVHSQQPWKTSSCSLASDCATPRTQEGQESTVLSDGNFPDGDTSLNNSSVLPAVEDAGFYHPVCSMQQSEPIQITDEVKPRGGPDEQTERTPFNETTMLEVQAHERAGILKDNLAEVQRKLDEIDPDVWGKLIVMERNYRTAKAYLRHQTIYVDGSETQFDGIRVGLANFDNERRDPRTQMELRFVGKGLQVQRDKVGNVWMRRRGERPVAVFPLHSADATPIQLEKEFVKVLDVREIRDRLKSDDGMNLERLLPYRKSMLLIKLTDPPGSAHASLNCPLWLALVSIVAFDMIRAIVAEELKVYPVCTAAVVDNTSFFSTAVKLRQCVFSGGLSRGGLFRQHKLLLYAVVKLGNQVQQVRRIQKHIQRAVVLELA